MNLSENNFLSLIRMSVPQIVASLVAVLVLILVGPLIYRIFSVPLLAFLNTQYAAETAPTINVFVWIIVFPILGFLLRLGITSLMGVASMYFIDKATNR